jgi:hypothetical protein
MQLFRRRVLLLLSVLAVVQSGLLVIATVLNRNPKQIQVEPGRLADAELRDRAPALLSRAQGLLPPEHLSGLIPHAGCAVVVFFSSTCRGLRQFSTQWKGLSALSTTSGLAPVSWVAAFPTDTFAADSALLVAGISRVRWMTRGDDASTRGVVEVPSAWILDATLRTFGATTDTALARKALLECWRVNASDARPPVVRGTLEPRIEKLQSKGAGG